MATQKNSMVSGLKTTARKEMYKTQEGERCLCYEVWYEAESGVRVLVGAYWDVMDAWRVMMAINESHHGNQGVAEVGVASGMKLVYDPSTPQETWNMTQRTDVVGPNGMKGRRPNPVNTQDLTEEGVACHGDAQGPNPHHKNK